MAVSASPVSAVRMTMSVCDVDRAARWSNCGDQRWLIDSGLPDLTERFAPRSFNGIFQTHYHADHAQGLLHLRWGQGLVIPVHGPVDPQGWLTSTNTPAFLTSASRSTAFESRAFGELKVTALPLLHSKPTLGYLLEGEGRRIAYLTDTVGLPPETTAWLQRQPLDVLVLDCSMPPQPQAPRNHNDLNLALQCIEELQAGVGGVDPCRAYARCVVD
jgi:phosphoribosyl 1,2-cyclic phosphate phosphodiesterase